VATVFCSRIVEEALKSFYSQKVYSTSITDGSMSVLKI